MSKSKLRHLFDALFLRLRALITLYTCGKPIFREWLHLIVRLRMCQDVDTSYSIELPPLERKLKAKPAGKKTKSTKFAGSEFGLERGKTFTFVEMENWSTAFGWEQFGMAELFNNSTLLRNSYAVLINEASTIKRWSMILA